MKKLVILFALCLISITSCSPNKNFNECNTGQIKPNPVWLKSSYSKPGFYSAVASGNSKKEARHNALGNLSDTIKVQITKKKSVEIQSVDGNIKRSNKVKLDVVSNEKLYKPKITTYVDRNCQWHALAQVDKNSVESRFLHLLAEKSFQKAKDKTISLKERNNLIDDAISLNRKANFDLLPDLDGGVFLNRYQKLKNEFRQSQAKYNTVVLLLMPNNLNNINYFSKKAGSFLINQVTELNRDIFVPDVSICTKEADCFEIALNKTASSLLLITIENIKFSTKNLGIRKAYLTLSIGKYNVRSHKPTKSAIKFSSHVLTRLKSSTDWEIAIERIVKNSKYKIKQITL